MIKKIITVAAVTTLTAATIFANETKFLPVLDDSYSPLFAAAAVGGYVKTEDVDGTGAYGVELSLTCPLFQLSSNEIRQQVSLVHSESEGLKTTTLELNPHVLFDVAKNMQVGFGPSLGVTFASYESKDDAVLGIGAGASINYDISKQYFVGLESRYQWTTQADFGNNGDAYLDNSRTLVKVGVHF